MNRHERRNDKRGSGPAALRAPRNVAVFLQQAVAAHQAGNLQEAERLYRQALVLNPRQPDALHLLGVIAFQVGAYQEALDLIGQALAVNDKEATYFNNYGNALRHLGKREEALASYRRALSLDPTHQDTLSNLGGTMNDLGRFEEAESLCRKALKLNPGHISAKNGLGIALYGQNRLEEAVRTYEDLLAQQPGLVTTVVNLGNARLKQGFIQEAETLYARACELDPTHEEARFYLTTVRFARMPIAAWEEIAKSFLIKKSANHRYKLFVGIALCIHHWVKGDWSQLFEHLKACAWLSEQIGHASTQDVVSLRAYMTFLAGLYDWTAAHPPAPRDETAETIALIGDSHSLTYAHSQVNWRERTCTFAPHLINGGKAWHIAQKTGNHFRAEFETAVARLAPKSRCLLSFGEIDCRARGGIWGHCKKHGGDPGENAAACARDYVRAVVPLLKAKGIDPAFLNVPAQNSGVVRAIEPDLTEEDIDGAATVIRCFNEALRTEASAHGCEVIDVYRLGAPAHHSDGYHLTPHALEAALRARTDA